MFKTKKGVIYYAVLVVALLLVLSQAYMVLKQKQSDKPDFVVGVKQFNLFKSYQEYYNQQIKTESSLLYYLHAAIIRMAENGGTHHITGGDAVEGCGNYLGFELWQSETQDFTECFPKDLTENYEGTLNDILPNNMWYNVLDLIPQTTSKNIASATSVSGAQAQNSLLTHNDIQRTTIVLQSSKSQTVKAPIKGSTSVATVDLVPTTSTQVDGLVNPPLVSYDQATALKAKKCTTPLSSRSYPSCRWTSQEDFEKLYSIENPAQHHLVLGNTNGNVVTRQMGIHLINLGNLWYKDECAREGKKECNLVDEQNDPDCCRAKLYVSSLSTFNHAANSHHNIGNAADISRCYDADGKVFKAQTYLDNPNGVFSNCNKIILDYFNQNMLSAGVGSGQGSFIGPKDCVGGSCTTAARAKANIATHYHHIHINPKDPNQG